MYPVRVDLAKVLISMPSSNSSQICRRMLRLILGIDDDVKAVNRNSQRRRNTPCVMEYSSRLLAQFLKLALRFFLASRCARVSS